MKFKTLVKIFASIALIFCVTTSFAQTINDAGQKMNDGIANYKAKKYDAAISSFTSCIDICKKVGSEGDEIKGQAENQLLNAYFKNALTQAKAKKFDASIASLDKMKNFATSIGDTDKAKKAEKTKSNIYVNKALTEYKAEKFDAAIASADKAIAIDAKYYKAYYAKGLANKDKENYSEMKKNMDLALKYGASNNKAAKTLAKIRGMMSSTFTTEGGKMIQSGNFAKAKEDLDIAMEYNKENKDTYYYLAIANNGLKSWDAAIAAANTAVSMETGNKSKIYFELGKAYEGKGDSGSACTSYKQVLSGPNVAAAKYQMENVLKCN